MQSFLEEVVEQLRNIHPSLEDIVFVLPSKRAGTFVRNAIAKTAQLTEFAPDIHSIESFIEQISGIVYATNTEQLFELYTTYERITKGEKDNFYAFSKWGQTLLQDFNEIDRYLIEVQQLFANLSAIQEIGVWSPDAPRTQMMQDYVSFWKNIETLYEHFNASLLLKGIGHQGLVYRKAHELIAAYLERCGHKTHIFIGFNALNTAEEQIIQRILEDPKNKIYWDIDQSFLDDPIHDAGLFIRQHLKTWDFFKDSTLDGPSTFYTTEKKIELIGVPKNVSQAKYVGHLLNRLQWSDPNTLRKTAVVLGDETLLNPILNAVPETLSDVNITMGYPLHKTNLASLFTQFMNLYINKDPQGWFYQPILGFLSNPYVHILFSEEDQNTATLLTEKIKNNNWAYVRAKKMFQAAQEHPMIALLFFDENFTPLDFTKRCTMLIHRLKEKLDTSGDTLSKEYLYRFHQLFVQLQELLEKHAFIKDMKSLLGLFTELLSSETLDFKGEPLQGLQIMGMLESRNLDFETVILTSVNEGILPSGKSNNSFIPFDLKSAFKLPTYKEKDAVYTYHFYRLLQRAKNIYLLYNTEPDVLEGGEKSRLIHQLLTDPHKRPQIKEIIAAPNLEPTVKTLEEIEKDEGLMALIRNHAKKGFSPTSLSNYIRNPIDFYKRNLLGIQDVQEVEETVAHNTFGTIVHDSLETLYTPFVGQILTESMLKTAKTKVKETVRHHFQKTYLDGDITRGKNLIAFNVVVRYIENFIHMEIAEIATHEIKIIALEQQLNTTLEVPELPYPIALKGKLDRIDSKDGITRIIDYKTGKVLAKDVKLVDWDTLTTEYSFSKAFQLLCYGLMYSEHTSSNTLQAGIISFKNLKSGLLPFTHMADTGKGVAKNLFMDAEVLATFQIELKKLVLEICNTALPFREKEV
ncbi:PD-(D/E)XK nuclease family protein [Maribacter sp.]|nr:PD-(D/E)XK nuclease family protein [Maribacter sp.]